MIEIPPWLWLAGAVAGVILGAELYQLVRRLMAWLKLGAGQLAVIVAVVAGITAAVAAGITALIWGLSSLAIYAVAALF
jgi:hypothetical protein